MQESSLYQTSYCGSSRLQPSNDVYSSFSKSILLNSRACRRAMSAHTNRYKNQVSRASNIHPCYQLEQSLHLAVICETPLTLIPRNGRCFSDSESAKSIMILLLHSPQNRCGLRFCPKKYCFSLVSESPKNSTSLRLG